MRQLRAPLHVQEEGGSRARRQSPAPPARRAAQEGRSVHRPGRAACSPLQASATRGCGASARLIGSINNCRSATGSRAPPSRSRNAVPDDLAALVDRDGFVEPAAERAEVGDLPVLPQDEMPLADPAVPGGARADDLAALVDRDRAAARVGATGGAEVGHPTVLPQEGMTMLAGIRCLLHRDSGTGP